MVHRNPQSTVCRDMLTQESQHRPVLPLPQAEAPLPSQHEEDRSQARTSRGPPTRSPISTVHVLLCVGETQQLDGTGFSQAWIHLSHCWCPQTLWEAGGTQGSPQKVGKRQHPLAQGRLFHSSMKKATRGALSSSIHITIIVKYST